MRNGQPIRACCFEPDQDVPQKLIIVSGAQNCARRERPPAALPPARERVAGSYLRAAAQGIHSARLLLVASQLLDTFERIAIQPIRAV